MQGLPTPPARPRPAPTNRLLRHGHRSRSRARTARRVAPRRARRLVALAEHHPHEFVMRAAADLPPSARWASKRSSASDGISTAPPAQPSSAIDTLASSDSVTATAPAAKVRATAADPGFVTADRDCAVLEILGVRHLHGLGIEPTGRPDQRLHGRRYRAEDILQRWREESDREARATPHGRKPGTHPRSAGAHEEHMKRGVVAERLPRPI